MAIPFSFEVQKKSYGGDRRAVERSAYINRAAFTDEKGKVYDYGYKASEQPKLAGRLMLPENAPDAMKRWTVADFWNRNRLAQRQKNWQEAREEILSLPADLHDQERIWVIENYIKKYHNRKGRAAEYAIHAPDLNGDDRNYHAHILVCLTKITPKGFGDKADSQNEYRNRSKLLKVAKAGFAEEIAKMFERKAKQEKDPGQAANYRLEVGRWGNGHLTFLEQAKLARERRDHAYAVICEKDFIEKGKGQKLSMAAMMAKSKGETSAEEEALNKRRKEGREAREALVGKIRAETPEAITIFTHDPVFVICQLMKEKPTFTKRDVERYLIKWPTHKGEATSKQKEANKKLVERILSHSSVVGCFKDGKFVAYSTVTQVKEEKAIIKDARDLASRLRGIVRKSTREVVLAKHNDLTKEQRDAFRHMTDDEQLAVCIGQAGAGKTKMLRAVADAYRIEHMTVRAISRDNMLVEMLREDLNVEASTVSSELKSLANGEVSWNKNTVVFVDETSKLSNEDLRIIFETAKRTGALLRFVGDNKQIGSIAKGGGFNLVVENTKRMELKEIWRVKNKAQKDAFNFMHEGKFAEALDIFHKRGDIILEAKAITAMERAVHDFLEAEKAYANKINFLMAFRNVDGDTLNAMVRVAKKAAGQIDATDHILQVRKGRDEPLEPAPFAVGDKIRFTDGAGKVERKRGFFRNNRATILNIEGNKLTVEMERVRRGYPKIVTFTVGDHWRNSEFNRFKLGWCSTVDRTQGLTAHNSFLYFDPLMGAERGYVGMSRHQESLKFYAGGDLGKNPLKTIERHLCKERNHRPATSYEIRCRAQPTTAAPTSNQAVASAVHPNAQADLFGKIKTYVHTIREHVFTKQESKASVKAHDPSVTQPTSPITARPIKRAAKQSVPESVQLYVEAVLAAKDTKANDIGEIQSSAAVLQVDGAQYEIPWDVTDVPASVDKYRSEHERKWIDHLYQEKIKLAKQKRDKELKESEEWEQKGLGCPFNLTAEKIEARYQASLVNAGIEKGQAESALGSTKNRDQKRDEKVSVL